MSIKFNEIIKILDIDLWEEGEFARKDKTSYSEISNIIKCLEGSISKIESSCAENKFKAYIYTIDKISKTIMKEDNDLIFVKVSGKIKEKSKIANGFSLHDDYHILNNEVIWFGNLKKVDYITTEVQQLGVGDYRVSFFTYYKKNKRQRYNMIDLYFK